MRFQIDKWIVGCLAILLLLAGSACSLVDEDQSAAQTATAEQESQSTDATDGGKADHADAPAPSSQTCSDHTDCVERPNAVQWCSPTGTCRYSCELGYGEAGGEVSRDGCECEVSNAGQEVCDGIDNDCDGVVDNPFAGGRVSAGRAHTCAVDATGAVLCWGDQTLDATEAGAERSGLEAFWEVRAGSHHTCALTRVGRAYCWGDNSYGQLGPEAGRYADEPVRVSEELRFIDIATGANHTCGLTYDSEVYCWGGNDYGQLGDGTDEERNQPAPIESNTQDFVDVTTGGFHTCAAKATGEVLCWGANVLGQAGQEELDDLLEPTAVDAPEALIFVEAGANHTCGLSGTGKAYCWGNDSHGQLGDETRQTNHEPQKVRAGVEFNVLSAGGTHTCAIAQDGRLYCWGSGVDGRLGNEESGAALQPRAVDSELAFSQVSAGHAHTCALSRDGHLYCWGDGSRGQLVAGRLDSADTPSRADCQ
ncbi:MAG: hypothetical protein ACLFVJ_04970 [Persicimonas sp.]